MKYFISLFLIYISLIFNINSQEKSIFPTYTIEATFQKLKSKYSFIEPIKPIFSREIISKENIIYKEINHSNLKLDIYFPSDNENKSFPTVVLIHGGGWLTGSKENQRIMAQNLALKGYVAITVSYRLGLEAKYPAAINDIKDAIVWVKQHSKKYHINQGKIAVLGASSGAQLATLVGVTPNSEMYSTHPIISNEIQAIINIDGIVSFIHPNAEEGTMASIWLGGSKESNFNKWKEASPLEYVNENSPPTIFINSSMDRFHAGRDEFVKILKHHKIYYEIHTLSDAPHSFWLVQPWFNQTFNYIIVFLDKIFK